MTMPRIIRVAAVQLPATIEGGTFKAKQEETLHVLCEMLGDAGRRGSDLALAGEYANLYHRSCSTLRREYVADPIPGPFTEAAASVARTHRMNIALPMFGTYRGVRSSWVVLLDRRGTIAGCYQKAHPIKQEQRLGIRPGNDLPVFTLDCCRVGIMTCMDIEYPEVAQVLMLRGAEVILFPHVQASWGELDWEIRYRARAIDTGLYVVSACYGYPEGTWKPGRMVGRSSVVGRDGLLLADAGRHIGVITHDLTLDRERVTHFFFDRSYGRTAAVIASRRPELYADLTEQGSRIRALRKLGERGGVGIRRRKRAPSSGEGKEAKRKGRT
jgi:predicted amidohydrolase